MAEESGGNGGRKVALVAGLGLIAVGAYQLTRKPAAPKPTPTPTPTPPPAPSGYVVTAQPSLIVRSGPGTSYRALGSLPYGAGLTIVCQGLGSTVVRSAVWDQISSPWGAGWVSDWYVSTPGVGVFSPGLAQCGGSGSAGGGVTPPTVLPPTGSGPARITDAMQLPPGLIVAIDCKARAGRAYFIESANAANSSWGQGTSKGFRTTYRWKRLIANDGAWLRMGDPWRAIRLVTQDCLNQLNTGPALEFGPILRSAPGWYNGAPLNGVINSVAGYCT